MVTRFPAYVVAEVPEPVRGEIQAIRNAFSTPTALLPVEITLLGSSGCGPIPAGTSLLAIQELAGQLFREIPPWEVSFSEIRIFPNTSIAYLAPADRLPFDRLHQMLRESSLPYSDSPFPYTPHCTLRSGRASKEEMARVVSHSFPASAFLLDTISVYELDPDSLQFDLICQKKLDPITTALPHRKLSSPAEPRKPR